jgi:hypothetical protein
MAEDTSTAISASAPPVNPIPTPEIMPSMPEKHMTLSGERWARLRKRVNELAIYERPWSAGGWAALGLFGGSVVALVPWVPVYMRLDAEAQRDCAWVTVALVFIATLCAIVALLCLAMTRSNRNELKRSSGHIVEEMDEIFERFKKRVESGSGRDSDL